MQAAWRCLCTVWTIGQLLLVSSKPPKRAIAAPLSPPPAGATTAARRRAGIARTPGAAGHARARID